MAKKTYIATAPDGSEHKRTSENRTYTHAVLGRHCYEIELARDTTQAGRNSDGSNWDYYMACAGGTHEHASSQWTTDKQRAEWAAFAAANPDRTAYIKKKQAGRIDALEAKLAAGFYDAWHAITWCGRPDLAQKQIAANAKWWVDLRVVPAVLKGGR